MREVYARQKSDDSGNLSCDLGHLNGLPSFLKISPCAYACKRWGEGGAPFKSMRTGAKYFGPPLF